MANTYKVVISTYADTFKNIDQDGKGKSRNNTILMGSYVKLLDEENGDWQKVSAFSIEGWIKKSVLGDSPGYKCFYVDVGQGDGALIEVGNDEDGLKILIDGGPSDNLSRYLSKWQYKYYLNLDKKIHFDYVFISHFDSDHFNGLIEIINDENYTFGKILHNGIAKFKDGKNDELPQDYNTKLGKKIKENNVNYLITYFNSIQDLENLKKKGGLSDLMDNFLTAVKDASLQGRLKELKRIDYKETIPSKTINGKNFDIEILGPVTSDISTGLAFKYFKDESHTINGHSLILKIKYGNRTFLYGGDLNIPSEDHLIDYYKNKNVFEVDVAKSCHHGASEFTTDFMGKVNPLVTVISSGDNESYSHPRADAIGCAGKYSRSKRPLVFSTELARSSNVKTD
ncbi:MAG: MBL fold metallo-hydrolase, partial [Ignavibacteria bacterium]